MPRRTVNIKLTFSVVLDDDQEGLPFVHNPSEIALRGVRGMKGLTEIKPGASIDMKLDRESWNELRRRDRIRRANTR